MADSCHFTGSASATDAEVYQQRGQNMTYAEDKSMEQATTRRQCTNVISLLYRYSTGRWWHAEASA